MFLQNAKSQGYYPRYAFNSNIVADTRDITPGGKLCRDIRGAHGQAPKDGGLPQTYAYSLCDALRAAVEGFAAGGGLDGSSMKTGIGAVGPEFPPAVTFSSGLSATSPVFSGAARDIGYRTACECYVYLSPPRRF